MQSRKTMTTQERIKAAEMRIKELRILIKYFKNLY
tara:strand:+ start:888 stop:992 length:105 start_codon:yes stop_codon:yes gene_type:complete